MVNKLRLIIYADDFQMSTRSTQKVYSVYIGIDNIYSYQRQNVKIAMLCYRRDIRDLKDLGGVQNVLKPLVDDLVNLKVNQILFLFSIYLKFNFFRKMGFN